MGARFDVSKRAVTVAGKNEMSPSPTRPSVPRENLWLNLICNIALPTLVLTKLSGEHRLGPTGGLIVALAFPLGYGVYDFVRRRRVNFLSILGFLGTIATGGLGLMKLSSMAFAIKEAAMPTLIGAMVLISQRTSRPLVKELLFNEQVIDLPRIEAALAERQVRPAFDRLLNRASGWLALTFLLSAVANFVLARWLLQSAPGTPEFNAELGRMNLLSWPVIALPSTVMLMVILWRMLRGIEALTGLTTDEVLHHAQSPGEKAP